MCIRDRLCGSVGESDSWSQQVSQFELRGLPDTTRHLEYRHPSQYIVRCAFAPNCLNVFRHILRARDVSSDVHVARLSHSDTHHLTHAGMQRHLTRVIFVSDTSALRLSFFVLRVTECIERAL